MRVIQGTGPGGRITKDDVLRVAETAPAAVPAAAPAAPGPVVPAPARMRERLGVSSTIPLRGMRGRVAERMFQSWNTIPRVTEVMQVDMSATVAFREAMLGQWEQQYGVRISLNDMITRAVAVALRRQPRLNATLVEQEVRLHDSVNMGIAVNLDEGLIVPVIFNADQKDLGQIAREGRDLAEKARAGRLQLDEIWCDGRLPSPIGHDGIELFTPIINPPQVAILGVGTVQRRPVVVGDALAVRPRCISPGLRSPCRTASRLRTSCRSESACSKSPRTTRSHECLWPFHHAASVVGHPLPSLWRGLG